MNSIEIVETIVANLWKNDIEVKLENFINDSAEILSPVNDFIRESTGPLDKIRAIAEYWKAAFPDVKSEWVSVNEIEAGMVVISWKAEATHTGEDFCEISSSDKPVKYTGKTTYFIENNKLVKYAADVDLEEIKEQIKTCVPEL